jgi:hypothetical protein
MSERGSSSVTLDGSPAKSAHTESTGFLPGVTGGFAGRSSTSSGSAATPTDTGTPADAGQDDMDDDWGGGLHAETSANQTIIQNKPGPQCPDNILHNYANYTYKISLLCWDTIKDYNADIQHGMWPLKENNKKVLFSTGGIAKAGPGHTGPPGRDYPSPAERHTEFDVDFYITSFTTTSIMGMSGESRATNIFECDMEVVEPIGATLLERFYTLVTRDGRENWGEFPLLIKIDFIGYDDAGKPGYIKEAMRMIPVRLINLAFDVAGEGSTYSLQFIASTTIKKDHPRNIKLDSEELWGKTVKEFCDQFAEHYNKAQKARTKTGLEKNLNEFEIQSYDEITAPKVQDVNDEIVFDIDERIANAKLTVEHPVAEDTPLKMNAGGSLDRLAASRKLDAKEKAALAKTIVPVDPNKDTKISIQAGTKQIAVIEKIITCSSYITDQLKDVKTLEKGTSKTKLSNKELLNNPDDGLWWWKITYIPTLKDWDDIRGQYGTKTIVQITPYIVSDPVSTGGKCNIGEGVISPAMRNYQYIYTGQNIDVKDFGISFNNAFIQSMLGQGTGDSKKAKVTETAQVDAGGGKSELSSLTTASADQSDSSYSTGSNLTSKQQSAGTILENLYRKLGSDMMQCSIRIVGDPLYIQQDGILNLGRKTKTGDPSKPISIDQKNGAALCDHQDAHIFLSYKTPTDYNEATGLMDFNMGDPRHRSSTLSGYYRVWEVVNTFSNGEFNQDLNLTRVYNQWREHQHNPDQDGGGNDKSDFEWGTHDRRRSSGSIVTSGGSAKTDTTSTSALTSNQKKQIAVKKETLLKQIDIELNASMNEETNPGVLSEHDFKSVSSNTSVANQNATNKQNTNEAKIKFRAAEAKLANINNTYDSTSAGQENTNADRVNARASNVTSLKTRFDGDGETPVFIEKAGEPAGVPPQFHGQEGKDWWIDEDGKMNIIIRGQSGANSTTNGNTPLFNYNKKDGLYGLAERGINMASYTTADKTAVNTNDEIIRTQREILIGTGDLAAKKTAYVTANAASKTNQVIHGKYGNVYKTWEEVGYFQNLLVS